MKNSKKLISAVLAGTLALSSIGAMPMAALASEAQNGSDPVLVAQRSGYEYYNPYYDTGVIVSRDGNAGIAYSPRGIEYYEYDPYTGRGYYGYDYNPYSYNYNYYGYNYNYNYYNNKETKASTVTVYRLLNPTNGDHVYNSSTSVRDKLLREGWKDEGTAWKALESSSRPVYQLRNTVTGRYHYTTSTEERDSLVKDRWENDGVAFYASDSDGSRVYRVLNPVNGSHFFTQSASERDDLVKAGWGDEGTGFYVAN